MPSADAANLFFPSSRNTDFKIAHNFRVVETIYIFQLLNNDLIYEMLNQQWNIWLSRVLPYWLTVLAVCWTLAYFYLWKAPIAYARYGLTVTKVRSLSIESFLMS